MTLDLPLQTVGQVSPKAAMGPPRHALAATRPAPIRASDEPTILVLDLVPERGIAVASALAKAGLAYAVLLIRRWPAVGALLPSDPVLGALLAGTPALHRVTPRHLAIVLDGPRQRPGRARGRADNRYRVFAADLPSAEMLRAAGFTRVLHLSGARVAPPMLDAVYPAWERGGLRVERRRM